MLGFLTRTNPDVHGLTGHETNLLNTSDPSAGHITVSDTAPYVSPYDPCHGLGCVTEQIYGADTAAGPATMDGFAQLEKALGNDPQNIMDMFTADRCVAQARPRPRPYVVCGAVWVGVALGISMCCVQVAPLHCCCCCTLLLRRCRCACRCVRAFVGTHARASIRRLPVLSTLAQEFALFDEWYASVPGPTNPNRRFLHCATACGSLDDADYDPVGFTCRSVFDNLDQLGIDWAIHYYDWCVERQYNRRGHVVVEFDHTGVTN